MATVAQCERAMHRLADILAGVDESTRRKAVLDRTLSCHIRDLDVVYRGELRDGHLRDIRQDGAAGAAGAAGADAAIRLALNSDDLIDLTDGTLPFGRAWASGRVRIEASVLDLLRLRALV